MLRNLATRRPGPAAILAMALLWPPLWCGLLASSVAGQDSPRPNFLVILCDDLGYGDLACYGHKTIETPHLDKLAGQGIRFTSCYAAAPVCSPSRCGLLTGRTPSRLGVYDWISAQSPMHLPREEITVAALLRGAGYDTCHVGKWHCNGKFNSPDQPQPGDHGFNHWFSTQNNAAPSHENPTNFVRNGKGVGPTEGFSCQLVADEAIAWLKHGRDKTRPFFQFVCFHEPHEPIASPADLVAQYATAEKRGEALYYANVTNLDRATGRVLAALDELHLGKNTLVFFTSDNGPETLSRYANAWRSHGSAGPLRGMKLHLYEGGIRVPGLLRFPARMKGGQVSDAVVCSLDLLPTFCELAGVQPPAERKLDGESLAPLFAGQAFERKTPLFWHYYRSLGKPKAALRSGDWMILGHWDGPASLPAGAGLQPGDAKIIKEARLTEFELYNLRADMAEETNLAAKEPEKLAELSALLKSRYLEVVSEGKSWSAPEKKAP